MNEVSQETTASEEASSEYYEINAPGFMGFYLKILGMIPLEKEIGLEPTKTRS